MNDLNNEVIPFQTSLLSEIEEEDEGPVDILIIPEGNLSDD